MVKKAVLCGINNYQSQTDLRGCINDVNNMFDLLTQNFGFVADSIHKLFDQQVTKAAIQTEWNWLLQGVQPGDELFFHFSGHGSYVPDDGSDESDGLDEITCLYDMNFYDSQTFLRDDEWNQMLERVPQGVQLTLVMDNCHSGTGTRSIAVETHGQQRTLAVDVETSIQRGAESGVRSLSVNNSASSLLMESRGTATLTPLDQQAYEQIKENEAIVLPRFLVPPADLMARVPAPRTAKVMRSSQAMPYLLFTGCRADQTAADAHIASDFHGAFTYYLCDTLRKSPELGSEQLIQTVSQMLQNNQFAQVPQHEGQSRPAPVFGTSQPPDSSQAKDDLAVLPPPPPTKALSHLDAENQRLLIQAYLKLLDTIAGTPTVRAASTPTANRYLVYVHGISQHRHHYSDSWWNALKPYVGNLYGEGTLGDNRLEVLWSDLVNARALTETGSIDAAQQEQLRREITFILEERQRQEVAANTGGGQAARQMTTMQTRDAIRGGGFSLDDFLVYMTNSSMRQRIIDRFTEVVKPLLANGDQVDIISHSWGTVVAYEGMRELEQAALPGRVANWFTLGSALSLGPVRLSLREANQDGRRPTLVDEWINVDAQGDLVGGMVGDRFDVTKEFLNMMPTGCTRGLFGYNLVCAHSSYFQESNLTVNRDIIALYMNS